MENKQIIVKGARENNLKNIDITIPKYALTVFTGLSGCGKTTLAFDTIFAEGQRRFVESLSSYARQFLGGMEKPDVDTIEGLSPAISIDQKTTSHNPRSTVGTVTEIYDYLRLLFARVGVPYCPKHHEPIVAYSPAAMTDGVLQYEEGTKVQILAPIVKHEKGTQKDTLDKIKKQGFTRVRVDEENYDISDEILILDKQKKHTIDVIIDRIVVKKDIRNRIADSVELALNYSNDLVIVSDITKKEDHLFSQSYSCPDCMISLEELTPRMFSFNSPFGACPDCTGLGEILRIDPEKIMPNKEKRLSDYGAIQGWSAMGSIIDSMS